MSTAASIAILGATGLVGRQLVDALEQRQFPISSLQLYASPRSAGEEITCGALTARVELIDTAKFGTTDIVIAAAGEEVSAKWAARAAEDGAMVIDLSQLYLDDPDIPVVVPELNAAALADVRNRNIVTSPDAIAVVAAVVLQPLHEAVEIRRVVLTSFEPVSGAGAAGIEELQRQTVSLMSGQDPEVTVFQRRIAFNVIPQVGEILAGGSTRGELAVAMALGRLLDAGIAASVTRVRVPTFYGLGMTLNVETAQPLSAEAAHDVLRPAPGLLLTEVLEPNSYPTPADTIGEESTYVGRLRCDPDLKVIDLWVAADNMRKGSAVNAVQIAEILLRDYR